MPQHAPQPTCFTLQREPSTHTMTSGSPLVGHGGVGGGDGGDGGYGEYGGDGGGELGDSVGHGHTRPPSPSHSAAVNLQS